MKLAIFDIDGTLTATSKVDADCYVKAIDELFSIKVDGSDWSRFRNYTDSGIFIEVFEQTKNRKPKAEENQSVQKLFIDLLQTAYANNPELFAEVPGARLMMKQLNLQADWIAALATGCWRASAELKLDYARITRDGLPIATCDEFIRREEIMMDAHRQARQIYKIDDFERIVYIGDGIWDARGSRNLGFNFVGIRHEGHHHQLTKEGANFVFPNYLDFGSFMNALENARIP